MSRCSAEAHNHAQPINRTLNGVNGHAAPPESDSAAADDSPALRTLRRFVRAQETRTALWKEFDEAFESNLAASPQERLPSDSSDLPPADRTRSRNVSDAEMQEVIRIATAGMLEVKDEILSISRSLRDDIGRPDLAKLVDDLQAAETTKLQPTLLKQQARRIARVDDGRDFTSSIGEYDCAIAESQERISELLEELRSEMAEL